MVQLQTYQYKANRYYIANNGYKIIKKNTIDDREIQLESGKWKQILFNKIEVKNKFSDYNINKKYYIQAVENEINNILKFNKNQLTIF